ncbi:MAG: histidine kinase [Duganella sp.]
MTRNITLRHGWHSLWELRRHPDVPTLPRLLAASLIAVALALGLMSFVAVFGRVNRPGWWWASLLPNIVICLCIVHTLFGVLRLAARWLPPPLVERMADVRDIRAGMALSGLALAGIIAGMTIGFTIVPILVGFNVWGMFISLPAALTKFAIFILFVMAINWLWWRARLRRQQLQSEATEARLRLLQGQIEPHLLFNTLATIHSLMDYDPPRAKHMLETFSGYLRGSLTQLRGNDSTLEAELGMARQYLTLLQIRMEDRLRFHIDASAEARLAAMPPLMLQPLVENAIRHGLAPKLDGGSITIHAAVRGGRLQVRVLDDGIGLRAAGSGAPAAAGTGAGAGAGAGTGVGAGAGTGVGAGAGTGAGMALANLRARLHTRFGAGASLTLHAREPGAEAALDLPYRRSDGSALPELAA